jgi:nucleoside-diphosphate-sugar epimerase
MERVLVTGANGFIGSNVCAYLLERSYEVYGLVRETSDLHFLEGLPVTLIRGDLTRASAIPFPSDLDFIIHAASLVSDTLPSDLIERNIFDTTRNLISALEEKGIRLKRFIHISTSLVLGYKALNISEERPGRSARHLPYTRAKEMTEAFLLDHHRRTGFPVVILRPADVFGPNDRTSSLRVLDAIERGWPAIAGSGDRIFGYCYVANLSAVCHLVCQMRGTDGRAYTVTNGQDVTWREFLGMFQVALDKKQHIYVPVVVAYAIALCMQLLHAVIPSFDALLTFYRISRVANNSSYDITKTVAELGYQPDHDIESQTRSIVAWYLKEKACGYVDDVLRGRSTPRAASEGRHSAVKRRIGR